MGRCTFVGHFLCVFVFCYINENVRCLNAGVMAEKLPAVITKGTHFEVGYDVGSTFRQNIQDYYAEHPSLRPQWLPWSHTPEGQRVVKGLLSAAESHFPQYVDEMHGMAKGANVSFIEMFLANHYVELSAIFINRTADTCSDVFVNYPHTSSVILGHNEDNTPLIQNKSYILTATIVSETSGSVLEEFTAYCYPGQLPGNAFGFNGYGLVLTVNGLYSKLVIPDRVGRSFLTRAMLVAPDIKSVVDIARVSSAYSLSANVGSWSEGVPILYNVEVAPNAHGTESIISTYQVTAVNDTCGDHGGSYFHVNMFRRISIPEIVSDIQSSIHRTARIKEFPPPSSLQAVLSILGDTKDRDFPIYRTSRPTDNEVTLATAVFDLLKCTLAIYLDNPKSSSGPLTVFSLSCPGR